MVGYRRIVAVFVTIASVVALGASPANADHNGNLGIVGSFEIDGNFSFDGITVGSTTATRDWANVGDVVAVTDHSNSTSDNIFTQGSKENEPDTWVFTQGKPSGKTDLTRAYIASEVTDSSTFLWLGFERLGVQGSGSANINFEINKKTTTVVNSLGTEIPERSDRDVLVVYDYDGGTGPVNIEVFEWDGAADDPNTPRNEEALFGQWVPKSPPSDVAFGDINSGAVTRPAAAPFNGDTVDPRRFGEVGIDIDALFGERFVGCPGFGSFYAKSRASGNSFNSALEDLTPRGLMDFSNCAQITVHKLDDDGNALNGATFGLFEDSNDNDVLDEGEPQVSTCVTGEEGQPGQCTFEDVEPGEYLVRELSAPLGYAFDPTITPVSAGHQEHVVVEHVYTNIKVQYRLTLTPKSDSNLVGTDHVIVAMLEVSTDGGSTWEPAPDEPIGFTLAGPGVIASTDPQGETPDSCVTDDQGTCEVTLHSADPGQTTLTAHFQKVTATTPVEATDDAGKTWVNYRITVTPPGDTNVVDNPHVFTVTLERNDGDGWEPVEGATPDVSLDHGTITDNTCADPGTDASGVCAVTITSTTAGTSTVTVSYIAVEGGTSREFEATAEKLWIDFRVDVTPATDTNPVSVDGGSDPVFHTFTVIVEQTDDGESWTPVVDAMPFVMLDGVGAITGESCSDPGTDASGTCSVTITSSEPGQSTLTAVYLASINGSSGEFSDSADKFWEDNALTVTPGSAFNKVGDPHVFTVTLTRDTGDGPFGYEGQPIDVSLDPDGSDAEIMMIGDDPASGTSGSCTTDASGACEITINATTPGTTVLTVTWNGIVGETSVSRTASASKTYLAVSVTKEACPESTAPVGGIVTYEVEISAAGAGLTNALVSDDLPPEVSFVAASDLAGVAPVTPAQGESNGTVTWTIPVLPEGDYEATITVTVNEVPEGSEFTNSVSFEADEFAGDPETASLTLTVADGGEADARAFGLSVDLLGNGVIAPTPDTNASGPAEVASVPDPFGGTAPLARVIQVDEETTDTATSASSNGVATALGVNIAPGPIHVQASSIVARSASQASITGAGSSSGGSRVQDMIVNGTRHGDITEPVTIIVRDPVAGIALGEVHVLEETPSGAAAGDGQPSGNADFDSGLAINGIRVVVYDQPLTPIDDSSEIIVAHAASDARFLSGIGCVTAPSVGGDAAAIQVRGLTPNAGDTTVGRVTLPSTGGSDSASLLDVSLPSGVSATGTTSTNGSTSQDPEAAEAHGRAVIEAAVMFGPLVRATLIEATADATLAGTSGATTIADLVINGRDVCDELGLQSTCTPAANTVLLLGSDTIVMLNEQIAEPNGLRVNAVHIWLVGDGNPFGLPAGAEIILSSARAVANSAPPLP